MFRMRVVVKFKDGGMWSLNNHPIDHYWSHDKHLVNFFCVKENGGTRAISLDTIAEIIETWQEEPE